MLCPVAPPTRKPGIRKADLSAASRKRDRAFVKTASIKQGLPRNPRGPFAFVPFFAPKQVYDFVPAYRTKEKSLANARLFGGIKWARTIDLHDVNVAL